MAPPIRRPVDVDRAARKAAPGAGERSDARAGASVTRLLRPTDTELRTAQRRLHAKATFIVAVAAASYWVLVFSDIAVIGRLASAIVLVVALVAVATGIMHDANHGAFSRSKRLNRAMGCTLDLLGGSSLVWRVKHNTLHHASTNVVGVDTDIDQAPFARLAPQQRWRRWHRCQHLYLWVLYGVMAMRWFLVADFVALARNRVGTKTLTKSHRARAVAGVVAGKAAHLSWALLIPLALHPWWKVVAFYVVCSWCLGLILAVTFQLAHCVEQADFVNTDVDHRGRHFVAHQLETTVDVRCSVPGVRHVVGFMMGGLDHQIEHHLAPGLPHTIYPTLARRLAPQCRQSHLNYRCHPSLSAAISSHARWLHHMGNPPGTTTA